MKNSWPPSDPWTRGVVGWRVARQVKSSHWDSQVWWQSWIGPLDDILEWMSKWKFSTLSHHDNDRAWSLMWSPSSASCSLGCRKRSSSLGRPSATSRGAVKMFGISSTNLLLLWPDWLRIVLGYRGDIRWCWIMRLTGIDEGRWGLREGAGGQSVVELTGVKVD